MRSQLLSLIFAKFHILQKCTFKKNWILFKICQNITYQNFGLAHNAVY